MDKEKRVLYNMIPYLDDHVFQIYAGLCNAQRLEKDVTPQEELEILRYVLRQEWRRTGDPEYPYLEDRLERLLQ